MNVAICDDNNDTASQIEQFILDMKFEHIEIDVFLSGTELVKYLKTSDSVYHLYFLDIEMDGINGIETADLIRHTDSNAVLIFVTDYKDYVWKVFEVLPFRFIQKPISRDKIVSAFCDVMNYLSESQRFYTFGMDKSQMQIPCEEIMYFESDKRKVHIITSKQSYSYYDKLMNIEGAVPHNLFTRIHVSYLVNMSYIKTIHADHLEMANGNILPISKKYSQSMRDKHLQFSKWRLGI